MPSMLNRLLLHLGKSTIIIDLNVNNHYVSIIFCRALKCTLKFD